MRPESTRNDRVSDHLTVTPSVGGAVKRTTGKTVLKYCNNVSNAVPPEAEAWSRPANKKSPSSRPANKKEGMKPSAKTPAKTRVKANDDAKVQVCTHLKGGVCTIHWPGAKLRWIPGKCVKGEQIQEKRNYFYVCEPDKKPKNKMIQMKLTFTRLPNDATMVEENKRRTAHGE